MILGFRAAKLASLVRAVKKTLKNNHINQSQILLTKNRFLCFNLNEDLIFPFTWMPANCIAKKAINLLMSSQVHILEIKTSYFLN